MTSKTYGLLADIHANDVALKIAIEQLEQQGVDEIICSGDIVGYGGCPNEVISLLKKKRIKSILGNHDFYLLALLLDEKRSDYYTFLPELLELSTEMKFREIAVLMFEFQKKIISESNSEWLSRLPVSLTTADKDIFTIHGAPPEALKHSKVVEINDYSYALNKYLFPWDQNALSLSCQLQPAETIVVGHTHMQFAHQSRSPLEQPIKTAHPCLMKYELFPIRKTFTQSYPLLVNPGSVGQSRDEINAPGYATLTFEGKRKRVVTWYRYKYDYDEFASHMKSKSVPQEILDKEFWNISE